ncbi:MAG TPA: hypothetical protein VIL55_09935, partial [Naasia sp.]
GTGETGGTEMLITVLRHIDAPTARRTSAPLPGVGRSGATPCASSPGRLLRTPASIGSTD